MTQKLNGKVALITGGGSSIGASICPRLAAEGAQVVVVDLDAESAEKTSNEIISLGGKSSSYPCDIANTAEVSEVFKRIQSKHSLDILINNAGIAHIGNIEDTSEADLDRLYSVNVKGVYNAISAIIPNMKKQGSGVIVNMASVASSVGIPERFAYSMTKGAILTMTLSVAKDYIDDGIRCNCISPGRVHTPFVDGFLDKNYPDNRDEMFDKLSKSQPIGRVGKAEEIAGLAAYLCSDEASFITGSNFPIDGGFITLNN